MATSVRFGLLLPDVRQVNPEIVLSNYMVVLESLCPILFEDRDLSAAPGSPGNGEVWLVAGTPSGGDDWETHGGDLAIYYAGWFFVVALEGMIARVDDENIWIKFDGTSWSTASL